MLDLRTVNVIKIFGIKIKKRFHIFFYPAHWLFPPFFALCAYYMGIGERILAKYDWITARCCRRGKRHEIKIQRKE